MDVSFLGVIFDVRCVMSSLLICHYPFRFNIRERNFSIELVCLQLLHNLLGVSFDSNTLGLA